MSESERETVFTIDALITRRLADLDLSSVMLVERCGYANISKGLRRLASIRAGDLERASHILAALPKALEVSAAEVREAIEQTTAQLSAARERAWREAFRPHAIIRTERERPSQITIAIVCGFVSLRRIDFPDGMPALGYIGFTRSEIGARLARWRGGFPPSERRPASSSTTRRIRPWLSISRARLASSSNGLTSLATSA